MATAPSALEYDGRCALVSFLDFGLLFFSSTFLRGRESKLGFSVRSQLIQTIRMQWLAILDLYLDVLGPRSISLAVILHPIVNFVHPTPLDAATHIHCRYPPYLAVAFHTKHFKNKLVPSTLNGRSSIALLMFVWLQSFS